MSKNHGALQKEYIKDLYPNGYKLFCKKPYPPNDYNWGDMSINYDNNIFSYNKSKLKDITSKYDPELRGRGSNPIFSSIERTVNVATRSISSALNVNTPIHVRELNKKIIYGLHMLARLPALMKMDGYQGLNLTGENFNEILKSLIDHSDMLFKEDNARWEDVLNDVIIYNEGLKNKFLNRLYVGTTVYDEDWIISGDCSILYTNSIIVYPQSSNTLFWARIKNDFTDKIINDLNDNIHNWNNWVCHNSKLYILGSPNLPADLCDAIQRSFNEGFYNLLNITK